MAQLTWRELSTPDLSNVMRGQQMAGQFINQAIQGLQGGLQTYDDTTSQRVNAELAARIAAAQTPEQAQAIAAGIAGDPNANRFTAATLAALGNRPGVLTKQAADTLALSDARYNSDRTQTQNSALDRARPAAAQLIAAAASGDEAKYRSILSSSPELANLTTAQLTDLAKGGQNLVSGTVDIAGGRLNNEGKTISNAGQLIQNATAQFGLDVGRRNDADNQTGMAASQAVLRMVGTGSAEDARAALATMNLSPGAFNAALGGLEARYPGIYGSNAVAVLGTPGDYRGFMQGLESGGTSNPDLARNPNSSASGRYQFTDDTWLGTIKKANPSWARGKSDADLLSLKSNGQYQDMVETAFRADNTRKLQSAGLPATSANLYAMHHFGNTKFAAASNDTPINQILTPKQIEANPYLKGMTKGQVLQNWAQRSGFNVQDITSSLVPAGAAFSAQSGIFQRQSQNNVGSLVPSWNEKLADPRTAPEIADELAKGALRDVGENANQIGSRLQTIMKKTGGNAAQAGEILKQSIRVVEPERGIAGEIRNLFTPRRGDTPAADGVRRIDSSVVNSIAGSVANGSARNQFEDNVRLNDLSARANNAQALAAKAAAELLAAQRRASVDPAARALLPKYQADFNRANDAARKVLSEVVARGRDGTQSATPNRPGAQVPASSGDWGFFDFLRPRTGPAGSGR